MRRGRPPAAVPVAAVAALGLAASLSACSGSSGSRPAASRASSSSAPSTGASNSTTAVTTGSAATSTTAATAPITTSPAAPTTAGPAGPAVSPNGTAPGTAPANPQSPVDTSIKVYGDCTTASVEPAGIVLACGDYGESLSGLRWSTWTAGAATGVGSFVYNDCNPDCADGHQHTVPGMHVTLIDPVPGPGGQQVWSKIHFSPPPPGGFPATQPLPVRPV